MKMIITTNSRKVEIKLKKDNTAIFDYKYREKRIKFLIKDGDKILNSFNNFFKWNNKELHKKEIETNLQLHFHKLYIELKKIYKDIYHFKLIIKYSNFIGIYNELVQEDTLIKFYFNRKNLIIK